MDLSDFDQWNEKKKQTHVLKQRPYFKKGEIWWAKLGKNIATEVIGKGDDFLRPVLVLQVVYGDACLAIPLTSQKRRGDYYFSFVDSKGNHQCALLPQVRYLDGKRLKYKQSSMEATSLQALQKAFIEVIKK